MSRYKYKCALKITPCNANMMGSCWREASPCILSRNTFSRTQFNDAPHCLAGQSQSFVYSRHACLLPYPVKFTTPYILSRHIQSMQRTPLFLMIYPPVSLKLIVLMSSYGPCINDMCSYHQIPENLHLFIIAAQIILRAVILTCFPFLPFCKNPQRWTFWWSVHSKCFRWLCRNLRETFHASVKIFMHTHSSAIDIAP